MAARQELQEGKETMEKERPTGLSRVFETEPFQRGSHPAPTVQGVVYRERVCSVSFPSTYLHNLNYLIVLVQSSRSAPRP